MKRINAQWVFLIILMLWIPVLAFGYEVNGVEFVGPPAPEPVKHGIMYLIWAYVAIGCAGATGLMALILTVGGLWTSLKFNYHLYVIHGQFAFWTVDEGTKEWNNRTEVGKKIGEIKDNGRQDTDMTFLAWWPVLIVIVCVWFLAAVGSALWPVVLFLGLPFFLIRTIAKGRRKKQVFVDKLKDNDTNGLV